jgi:hypothetical protein
MGGGISTLWIYLISSVVEWEEGLTAAAARHFVHLAAGEVRVNLAYLLTHCKEDPVYVFPEMKMRGLSPNLHTRVSVNDLYIPKIGPPVLLQQNKRPVLGIHECRNWERGHAVSFLGIRIFGTVSVFAVHSVSKRL